MLSNSEHQITDSRHSNNIIFRLNLPHLFVTCNLPHLSFYSFMNDNLIEMLNI